MRHAVITGGSRGLGLAIARALLANQWRVTLTARKASIEVEQLAQQNPGNVSFIPADLASEADVQALSNRREIIEGADAFIANAAVGLDGLLTLTSPADIARCVQVNLVAPILLSRAVLGGMLTTGGSLIFISSIAAKTGYSGLSVYSATKAAMLGFSKSIAREYGSRNIRSNCVLPGFLETEMTQSLDSNQRKRVARRASLARLGNPKDIVGTVEFLLSPAGQFITGSEMVVDGGTL